MGLFGYLGIPRILRNGKEPDGRRTFRFDPDTSADHNDYGGRDQGTSGGYFQASLGLGATKWQSIFHVLLPACLPRIMTGVILAAGRGFGEAAALLYTTGSGSDLRWGNWNLAAPTCPLNPGSGRQRPYRSRSGTCM